MLMLPIINLPTQKLNLYITLVKFKNLQYTSAVANFIISINLSLFYRIRKIRIIQYNTNQCTIALKHKLNSLHVQSLPCKVYQMSINQITCNQNILHDTLHTLQTISEDKMIWADLLVLPCLLNTNTDVKLTRLPTINLFYG